MFRITRRRGFVAVKATRFIRFTLSRFSPRWLWDGIGSRG